MAESIERPPPTIYPRSSRSNAIIEEQLRFEAVFSEWAKMKCQDTNYMERFRQCMLASSDDDPASQLYCEQQTYARSLKPDFLDAGFATMVPDLSVGTADSDNYFFECDDDEKKKLIYQNLRPDMILTGYLTISVEGNWMLDVKGVLDQSNTMFSDMNLLSIKAICLRTPLSDGPKDPLYEKFRGGMLVKAMIVKVPENHSAPIVVSFSTDSVRLPWISRRHCLGYSQEDEDEIREYKSYNCLLNEDKSFHNPSSMLAIASHYKIRDSLSLLNIQKFEGEGIEVLRPVQSAFWASDLASMGKIYYEQKDPRARKAYKEALILDPKCVPAYMGISTILYQEGRFLEAYKHMRKVLKLDPDNQKAKQGLMKIEEKVRSSRHYPVGERDVSTYQSQGVHRRSERDRASNNGPLPQKEDPSSYVQWWEQDPLVNLKLTKRGSAYKHEPTAEISKSEGHDFCSSSTRHADKSLRPAWLTNTGIMVPDVNMIERGMALSLVHSHRQKEETSSRHSQLKREHKFDDDEQHDEYDKKHRKQAFKHEEERRDRCRPPPCLEEEGSSHRRYDGRLSRDRHRHRDDDHLSRGGFSDDKRHRDYERGRDQNSLSPPRREWRSSHHERSSRNQISPGRREWRSSHHDRWRDRSSPGRREWRSSHRERSDDRFPSGASDVELPRARESRR